MCLRLTTSSEHSRDPVKADIPASTNDVFELSKFPGEAAIE